MSEQTGFTYYGKTPSGVEMALTLPISVDWGPNRIAEMCAELDAALKAQGFTRSERLEPRSFGGGGFPKKQETPPPDDVVVPNHCDLPMKYVPEREKDGGGKVGAHWDCRKGRGCSEARDVNGNKYPFTDWHIVKKTAATAAPPHSSNEMHYGTFLTAASKKGYTKAGVCAQLHTNEAELQAMGAAGWAEALEKLPQK